MTNFSENEMSEVNCNTLLIQSIRIYREIDELYQLVKNQLSKALMVKAQATLEILQTLLQDARNIDNRVAENLKLLDSLSHSTEELLITRGELLNSLSLANKNVAGRAENAKALLRHEILSMSNNRNAIKGYKPVEAERKNIIQNFF